MSDADLDVVGLADYLHLMPQQISRMADRGKLPGRKVGGQWRFSRAEIHHWLEHRIGVSDDEELARMEGALERNAGPEDAAVSIAALLRPEAIAVPLAARTRDSVISSMSQLAAATGLLWDAEMMAQSVRAREQMQTTALDIGVALLHPRRPLASILAEPLLALGRTSQGIAFGGGQARLTDLFILICSVDDRGHLRTLARLSRLIGDPALLTAVREADDSLAVHRLIAEHELRLIG